MALILNAPNSQIETTQLTFLPKLEGQVPILCSLTFELWPNGAATVLVHSEAVSELLPPHFTKFPDAFDIHPLPILALEKGTCRNFLFRRRLSM